MKKIHFCFKNPVHSEVLIYDHVGSEYLVELLAERYTYQILPVRVRRINLAPLVLRKIWPSFVCWFRSRKRKGLSRSPTLVMELAEISAIAPKVVVTFVDNSSGFNTLSRLYSEAKFLAVQNGFRGIEVADMTDYLAATNFFCFGEDTKKRYEENGCDIGRYIIGGSLKDGLYRERNPGMQERRFDFCWVSQFRPARFASTLPGLAKNSVRLLEFLYKFCLENDKSLAIAGSCKPNALAQEVAFLGDYVDFTRVSFIPNNPLNFSSYYAIGQSEVSVTVNSTLGFEALARGEKVIFCNFLSDQYYDVPDIEGDVPWIIKGSDTTYDDFKNKLQKAYRTDHRYWKEVTQEHAQNLVHVSEKILPQDILLDEVARGISNRTTA